MNWKQNDWARLFIIVKFAYNNIKNASIGHTFFKLNYSYHSCISFKKNSNLCSKSKSAEELFAELRDLMIICQKNLCYAQNLQKRAYFKGVKL